MHTRHQPWQPIADHSDWQAFAACRGMDVELFFHPAGERRDSRTQRIRQAKLICDDCPVITYCRTYALNTGESYGIWGGLSEDDRARILGLPARNRPPPRLSR
jgi:WhiB family transcriptional regulator, redox-sensing transcriptional regulator